MAGFDVSGSGGAGAAAAPTIRALGNLGATETISMTGESWVWCTGTLDASCAITVTGLSTGDRLTLFLQQDGTGGRTLSINDGSGAVSLGIPLAAAATMKIELEYDGTNSQVDVAGGGAEAVTTLRKTANQTLTQSNTTLQNVTGLVLPVAANETWLFEMTVFVTAAAATMDLKMGWTVPASTTMLWGAMGDSTSALFLARPVGSNPLALLAEGATQSVGSAALTFGFKVYGKINVAGTAGNVQFQASQDASIAADITILEDTTLVARRIATS